MTSTTLKENVNNVVLIGKLKGDIITKMRGEVVSDYNEMLAIVDSLTPGDIIDVEVFRAGEYYVKELEISEEIEDSLENP